MTLLLGPYEEAVKETYPPEPLIKLVEARATDAPNKRDFYRELGTSPLATKNRKSLDGAFVDRICFALGVHPTSVYGLDYDIQAVS